MAEHSFREVMRELNRLCMSYDNCDNDCPIHACGCCGNIALHCSEPLQVKRIEENVMTWAAEHPEPKYPTWGEWLESEGICFSRLTNYERIGGFSIPQVFDYQIDGETAFICGDKVNTPIPTDKAQKLGIKPKEDA